MSDASACATLKLPVEGAPEVKGSVAYIVPQRVTWEVAASRYGGVTFEWTRAVLTGPATSSGRWKGQVIYGYAEVPDWLPIPHEWIERARQLVQSGPVASGREEVAS